MSGQKRARTPEEADELLKYSSKVPQINTPPRGLNIAAALFTPGPPPASTHSIAQQVGEAHEYQPGLPTQPAPFPYYTWPSSYADTPTRCRHPAPPGAPPGPPSGPPPMQPAAALHTMPPATQPAPTMYPGMLLAAQMYAGAPPDMQLPPTAQGGSLPPPPLPMQYMLPPALVAPSLYPDYLAMLNEGRATTAMPPTSMPLGPYPPQMPPLMLPPVGLPLGQLRMPPPVQLPGVGPLMFPPLTMPAMPPCMPPPAAPPPLQQLDRSLHTQSQTFTTQTVQSCTHAQQQQQQHEPVQEELGRRPIQQAVQPQPQQQPQHQQQQQALQ